MFSFRNGRSAGLPSAPVRKVSIARNFNYNGLGVSNQAVQTLKVPDGTARLLSLSIGPKVHFPIGSSVRG